MAPGRQPHAYMPERNHKEKPLRLMSPALYTEPVPSQAKRRLNGAAFAWAGSAAACLVAALIWTGEGGAAEATRQEKVILAFGDSLTAGYGVAASDAYPARLERLLRAHGFSYRVINAGVSGETTAGGLRRVDWVLQSRPHLVIVELGANDGLRGLPPAAMRDNLGAIIERFQAAGATVVLAGMKAPPNYGAAYGRAFAAVFPDLAAHYRIPLIPFFLEGVAGQDRYNQPDGLHPTSEGYRLIVERIWPVIRPLLTPS